MTTLQIIPNWKNKTAKFKGTIAAGEHVAVSIANDDNYIADATSLRLRVVDSCGRTLAQFPMPEDDSDDGSEEVLPSEEVPAEGEVDWASDLTPLYCILNLNTAQMLAAVKSGSRAFLFVLDDYKGKTLYFKDVCEVDFWPRRVGEEEPTNLDDYKDIIADFREDIYGEGGFKERVENAEANAASAANAAQSSAQSASAANTGAWAAANAAQTSAATAKNWATGGGETGDPGAENNAKYYAQQAGESATSAGGSATSAATAAANAEAWAVGKRNGVDVPSTDATYENNAKHYAAAAAASAQEAEETLENKADKATTYTKTEVDAIVAAMKTGSRQIVQSLPASGEPMVIYMVPKSPAQTNNSYDEYIWTAAGVWEKIGDTTIDLSGYVPTTRKVNGKALSADVTLDPSDIGASPATNIAKTALAQDVQTSLGKADTAVQPADLDPLILAQYYPDGSVKSTAEFTLGIKYGSFDTTNRTVSVLPFCVTSDSANDNSSLVGRVVIPPFVDAQGNGYISDDGTKYKVVGVSGGSIPTGNINTNLTTIVVPSTVTTTGSSAFSYCINLTSVSLPAATSIGSCTFGACISLTSVSLPAATSIGSSAFSYCINLTSVSLPAATTIGEYAFSGCTSLASVDFGDTPRLSVPSLGEEVFYNVPSTCQIVVPYAQYDAWTAASGWSDLPQEFVRHSEKADKPATFTTGNLAALDANGNPTDSGVKASGKLNSTSAAPAWVSGTAYAANALVTYDGRVYQNTGGATIRSATTPDTSNSGWTAKPVSKLFLLLTGGGEITGGKLFLVANNVNKAGFEVVNGDVYLVEHHFGGGTAVSVQSVISTLLSVLDKLDATSAAPAFSTSSTYAVDEHVTYNGKLYRCTTAVTVAGAWDASNWTADTMTDPDAVLDITAQNQLRVVAKDGTLLWAQGYALASSSSATLACDATNLFTFAATSVSAFSDAATYSVDDRVTYGGKTYKCTTAVETAGAWTGSANWSEDPDVQAFTLPSATTGKVGDFGLDIDNTANAATSMLASLTGLDSTFSVVVPKGENLNDMLTFEPGEMAELYFTLTAFRVNNLPTWHIVKQVVENGGATV